MAACSVSAFSVYRSLTAENGLSVQTDGQSNKTSQEKQKRSLRLSRRNRIIKRKRKYLKVKTESSLDIHVVNNAEILQRTNDYAEKESTGHRAKRKNNGKRVHKIKKLKLKPRKATALSSDVPTSCSTVKSATTSKAGFPRKPFQTKDSRPWTGPSLSILLRDLRHIQNSKERSVKLFEWLIAPVAPKRFFSDIWEKTPALIRRHNGSYYKGLFSSEDFDRILREDHVNFGVNLDVTSYFDGEKETHTPTGRALPVVVWDFYKNGCSLRLLNPQVFSGTVWNVLSILQESFGSMVGANVYLTPPGNQGFAPHYDDIEAFVIQLEGRKSWRVYDPRSNEEILPGVSSRNFTQQEMGTPIMDTVLEAGDMLYFPRGFTHQATCTSEVHSLHITLSTFQRNSWGDLLRKLFPGTLDLAIEDDMEFREGLPVDYLEYMGVQNSEREDDPRRETFNKKIYNLMRKLLKYAPIDAAVDQKAKDFIHDCLPPVLTKEELACTVYSAPARWRDGGPRNIVLQIRGSTRVRMLRSNIARLCGEDGSILLYYTIENSRDYHKEEEKCIEIDPELADGVELLLCSYPQYIKVDSLPAGNLDDKISLAAALYEKGLLMTEYPLLPKRD
ncbi:ribosomal oxygenase 1 [Carcharodon carcharias]|uniref:ribosomal oxygenase 1 n=1 Tax=Carcharodon carcharias TaxID=13397 RepID=UPI001B7F4F4F|nr:ribosomal oxygenase 1 [Carcharodon carcharias]